MKISGKICNYCRKNFEIRLFDLVPSSIPPGHFHCKNCDFSYSYPALWGLLNYGIGLAIFIACLINLLPFAETIWMPLPLAVWLGVLASCGLAGMLVTGWLNFVYLRHIRGRSS